MRTRMKVFHRILVPVDFHGSSRAALELAIELAKADDAELTVMHAIEIPIYAYMNEEYPAIDPLTPLQDAARAELAQTLSGVQRQLPAARGELRVGSAALEILAAIEDVHADLVVIGTHGRHGLGRVVLGSVAEKVVRLSPAPVLTVRNHPV